MKDLTRGNTVKTFVTFAIPLVLSGILAQAYNTIDTVIAGKILGEDGLAAIGATADFITMVSSIFWGYSVGFSVYIAQLFGAGDFRKIKNAIVSTVMILASFAAVLAALFVGFHDVIFSLLKVDKSIYNDTFAYFSVYVIGLFFITSNVFGMHLMNAFGESTFPFIVSIISAVLNVSGNLIFVALLGMGTAGLALASVLAALAVDIAYVIRIRAIFLKMGLGGERFKFGFSHISASLAFALPNMTQQMTMYLAGTFISPVINGLGKAATAGYSVSGRIYNTCAALYQNSTRVLANYSAQCVGAGKTGEIKKGVKIAVIQGACFVAPVLMLLVIFPEFFSSLFFEKGAESMAMDYAVMFTRYFLPFCFFQMLCNIFHALFRGVKATKHLLASTVIGAASRVIATLIFANFLGMKGVYIGWVLSWIIETAYSAMIFKFGNWLPKKI